MFYFCKNIPQWISIKMLCLKNNDIVDKIDREIAFKKNIKDLEKEQLTKKRIKI